MKAQGKKRIIVFSPHPDDDVLACGYTIAFNVKQGNKVYIVYLTDGRNSHSHVLGITADPTPDEVKQTRRREAVSATRVLDVPRSHLRFLDFEDGTLQMHLEEAGEQVKRFLEQTRPHKVYYPSQYDEHPDHAATSQIVESALRSISCSPEKFLYIIWSNNQPAFDFPHHKTTFDAGICALKRAAIYSHESQISCLFPSQDRPILEKTFVEKFLTGSEVFYSSPQPALNLMT